MQLEGSKQVMFNLYINNPICNLLVLSNELIPKFDNNRFA